MLLTVIGAPPADSVVPPVEPIAYAVGFAEKLVVELPLGWGSAVEDGVMVVESVDSVCVLDPTTRLPSVATE